MSFVQEQQQQTAWWPSLMYRNQIIPAAALPAVTMAMPMEQHCEDEREHWEGECNDLECDYLGGKIFTLSSQE